jgi:hypothetical protein
MPPYTYEQLIDLAEGRLNPAVAEPLRALVTADPSAAAELAALTDLIDLMRGDDSVDAPEHVVARAVRLMRPPVSAPDAGLLQRIVAVLRGDSRQPSLAAGLRSGQAVRSLSYRATAWDLDLQLTPQAGRWQLQGQLLGPELAGEVELSDGAEPLTAMINELGEFNLPPVRAGAYTLRLRLGTHEILVAPLELGP